MQAAIAEASVGSPLFIKLDLDCPVLKEDDPALLKLWNYIISRARVFGRAMRFNNQLLFLEPGQFIFGRIQASQDLDLSEWVVRSRINSLVDLGVLKKVCHKGGKRGYSIYQLLLKNVNKIQPKEEKSPQTQFPLTKPVCEITATTKKESFFSKKKQNNKTKPIPISSSLSEKDVCLSNSILQKNDYHHSLQRFGQDFLDWLLEKAKKYSNSPSNPIGLLIHMLRSGSYRSEYADIQKERKQKLEMKKRQRQLEELRKQEEKLQQDRMNSLIAQAHNLVQKDSNFKENLKAKVQPNLKLLSPFLTRSLGSDFSLDDVVSTKAGLSFFPDLLEELLPCPRGQGVHLNHS